METADPQGTLAIFAEVAVALAGFSGIVIAFGRRSHGALTTLEKRRLANLFGFSGLVLISSLTAIAVLHAGNVVPHLIWRTASLLTLVIGALWMTRDWSKVRRLAPAERAQVPNLVIYPFTIAAVMLLALLGYNVFVLGEAWPFFLALVLEITFAFQQFILLVYMGLRKPDD